MSKKKNKNNTEMIQLGSFECTSGKFVVSDPCYTLGTWCQGILENVKKGTWNAAILVSDEDDFGKRVSRLYAKHDSLNTEFPDLEPCWSECNFDVGVDSGQAVYTSMRLTGMIASLTSYPEILFIQIDPQAIDGWQRTATRQ